MNRSIIKGYEKIENDFGYCPSFHDDTIEKIVISSSDITFFIIKETLPKNMESYPVIKLVFEEVKEFELGGEL